MKVADLLTTAETVAVVTGVRIQSDKAKVTLEFATIEDAELLLGPLRPEGDE